MRSGPVPWSPIIVEKPEPEVVPLPPRLSSRLHAKTYALQIGLNRARFVRRLPTTEPPDAKNREQTRTFMKQDMPFQWLLQSRDVERVVATLQTCHLHVKTNNKWWSHTSQSAVLTPPSMGTSPVGLYDRKPQTYNDRLSSRAVTSELTKQIDWTPWNTH